MLVQLASRIFVQLALKICPNSEIDNCIILYQTQTPRSLADNKFPHLKNSPLFEWRLPKTFILCTGH